MFFFRKRTESDQSGIIKLNASPSVLENLESRELLSASALHAGLSEEALTHGRVLDTIEFSVAPAAVQSGLTQLASNDGLDSPIATQTVKLNNLNGMESYTLILGGTGVSTRLTVDQNGNAVTKATRTTTTWDVFSAASPNSAAEIIAIASALSLTAPTASTTVTASTSSAGNTNYLVMLAPADAGGDMSASHHAEHGVTISVDAQGNPVGNQRLPFSVIPSAIQTALNGNMPAGATALSDGSIVNVHTVNGLTLYSATFSSTGVSTTITVDAAGTLTSLPTHSMTSFSELTSAAQTELQTLATNSGATGTIDASQRIAVMTEVNGTGLYSLTVSVSSIDANGTTRTHDLIITVDAEGNPTTLPHEFNHGIQHRGDFGGRHESNDTGKFAAGPSFAGSMRRRR
jgi:hypothetical protein